METVTMTRQQEFLNYSTLEPWEREIVDKYPSIYRTPNPRIRDFYGDKYEELISNPEFTNLRYGFEFEKGWAKLVDEFSNTVSELVAHLVFYEIQRDAYVRACIYKSKMGTLEWQGDHNLISPYNKLLWSYVNDIERESATICELTGNHGVLCKNSRGWRTTLCRDKARELGCEPVNADMKRYWEKLDKE